MIINIEKQELTQVMGLTVRKLRQTHARRIILEEIKNLNSHPTEDEVYRLVQKCIHKVSLGTI